MYSLQHIKEVMNSTEVLAASATTRLSVVTSAWNAHYFSIHLQHFCLNTLFLSRCIAAIVLRLTAAVRNAKALLQMVRQDFSQAITRWVFNIYKSTDMFCNRHGGFTSDYSQNNGKLFLIADIRSAIHNDRVVLCSAYSSHNLFKNFISNYCNHFIVNVPHK